MATLTALKDIRAQIAAAEASLADLHQRETNLMALAYLEELEAEAAEAATVAASKAAAAATARSALGPKAPTAAPKTTLPVFCTADSKNLKEGEMTPPEDFVAFSYKLMKDLGPAFTSMSEKEFKAWVKTQPTALGEVLDGQSISKIYTSMRMLTDNIGKQIVVAVCKSQGGGLEIREITGPYRYSQDFLYKNSGTPGYMHQFPTKLIRKLTPQESAEVSSARKARYALVWSVDLLV
jgi:hypothetical protein